MPLNIVISNEKKKKKKKKKDLHDVKLHSFHTTPHAILKNRMFFLKYLYPTNRMLYSTIIGMIVIHEPNNLAYKMTRISAIKSHMVLKNDIKCYTILDYKVWVICVLVLRILTKRFEFRDAIQNN